MGLNKLFNLIAAALKLEERYKLDTTANPDNIRGKASLRLSPHKKWKQRRAGGRG